MDTWYTITELVSSLKLSRSALYELVATGQLRAHRIGPHGGGIRVSQTDLERFLAGSRQPDTIPAQAPSEFQKRRVTAFRHVNLSRALAAKTRRVPR
jgi:excisionase family DNA binding protein